MANREAVPNQLVSLTVQVFVGGSPVTAVLSSATLTIGSGSPITCTVLGMDLLATVPNSQSLGNTTFSWSWSQTVSGVTSAQTATYPVTIVAQPTGSSQSYAPINYVRKCVRLMEPDDGTVEQINANALTVYVDMPYAILRAYAGNLPGSGPDLLVVNYTDNLGQPQQFAANCWMWMSDAGYVILSADQGTQFLVSGVNGAFFDANALAINTRNANAGIPALLGCANASRFGYDTLLTNQVRPTVFIYDGQDINGSSSSSGG
jgi:hypothetical protein